MHFVIHLPSTHGSLLDDAGFETLPGMRGLYGGLDRATWGIFFFFGSGLFDPESAPFLPPLPPRCAALRCVFECRFPSCQACMALSQLTSASQQCITLARA